jgi:hypothetical protein
MTEPAEPACPHPGLPGCDANPTLVGGPVARSEYADYATRLDTWHPGWEHDRLDRMVSGLQAEAQRRRDATAATKTGANTVSAKTYQLPEALGAGEYEEYRHVSGGTEAPHGTVAFLINGCLVCVAAALLVEVVPPLPEEPPVGSVVLDRHDRAWQNVACGRGDWCCTVDDLGADWEELNQEHGPLTRLIPAPVVEPVTLPWHGKSIYSSPVEVSLSKEHPICVGVDGVLVSLAPDIADAMAAALTTAAAKARQS